VWYLFQGCVTGSVCTYIMSTGECLGDLQYIRIWHDNSGEGNDCSWYLHKIVVRDLQTEEWYVRTLSHNIVSNTPRSNGIRTQR
jgi:hypothetical protein